MKLLRITNNLPPKPEKDGRFRLSGAVEPAKFEHRRNGEVGRFNKKLGRVVYPSDIAAAAQKAKDSKEA